MIDLFYTPLSSFNICFYYKEIEEIIQLSRDILTRKKIGKYSIPYIRYKENFYPIFDIQQIFKIKDRLPPRYAFLIRDTKGKIKCAICCPNNVEEITLNKNSFFLLPDFLLRKQKESFIYALTYIEKKEGFLISFSELESPESVLKLIVGKEGRV